MTLRDKSIEDVDSFTYLGNVFIKDGRSCAGCLATNSERNVAFVQLCPAWKNSRISVRTNLRIFHSNVKSVLLYGSEAWKEIKTITSKLQTLVNHCLARSDFKRRILEDRRNRDAHADQETEVEMVRTYTEEKK